MDSDFDFKPLNDGLGFHRKPTSLDDEFDGDDRFALKDLVASSPSSTRDRVADPRQGAGSSGEELLKKEHRSEPLSAKPSQQVAAGQSSKQTGAKHNTKGVSELIAALPPSLDFFSEPERAMPSHSAKSGHAVTQGYGGVAGQTQGMAPGSAAANRSQSADGSSAIVSGARKEQKPKKSLIRMPLGREDYKTGSSVQSVARTAQSLPGQTAPLVGGERVAKAAAAGTPQAQAAVDQNLAKVFPHLGRLAGQSASASSLLGLMNPEAQKIPQQAVEEKIAVHFGSIVLDALVALGVGCILLAISLGITNANLMALLESSKTDVQTMALLAILFVAGGTLYVVGARSFLGATLGEWSYEVRVGEVGRRDRWYYPLLVFWRSALVIGSGIVVLPILSAVFGRDLLGDLTGLKTVMLTSSSSENQ